VRGWQGERNTPSFRLIDPTDREKRCPIRVGELVILISRIILKLPGFQAIEGGLKKGQMEHLQRILFKGGGEIKGGVEWANKHFQGRRRGSGGRGVEEGLCKPALPPREIGGGGCVAHLSY